MELTVDRYGPSDRPLTWATFRVLGRQHPPDAEAARAWMVLLEVQDLLHEWESQLVVGMGCGAAALMEAR